MNTINAQMVKVSRHVYKEWYAKTVLVQSCSNEFEGELNLETREIDIPVYHDLSIHLTSLKERELKPANIEFMKASTKRVSIDKGRYTHWGETNINKLVNKLTQEKSEILKKLTNKWATSAEKELAEWVAGLGTAQTIDFKSSSMIADSIVDKDNVVFVLDVLKAHAMENDMDPEDFTFFVSERFEGLCRDAKLSFEGITNDATFARGTVGKVNGVNIKRLSVSSIVTRDATTSLVDAEWGVWKTRDGIQYVVPYKNTISYEISPQEILGGGTGYQSLEYYDFFNLYPTRLYKVQLSYDGSTAAPTSF